jgi:hypothetical protein
MGSVLPLAGAGADAHVVDRAPGRRMRPLPDEHLSRLGPLLEACTDVDRIACHHQLSARRGLPPGDHLAVLTPMRRPISTPCAGGRRVRGAGSRRVRRERPAPRAPRRHRAREARRRQQAPRRRRTSR